MPPRCTDEQFKRQTKKKKNHRHETENKRPSLKSICRPAAALQTGKQCAPPQTNRHSHKDCSDMRGDEKRTCVKYQSCFRLGEGRVRRKWIRDPSKAITAAVPRVKNRCQKIQASEVRLHILAIV